MKVYEKTCYMCGRVFYTTVKNQKSCGDSSCRKNYVKKPKKKKYKKCLWCGTQHYNKNGYCSEHCKKQYEELKERRTLCKKLKCKYLKYIGPRYDSNMICEFKCMNPFAPDSEKPCVKYKEGEKNDN